MTYVSKNSIMLNLIYENHALLLFLQHFDVDFSIENKTVEQLCLENEIDTESFIVIANLYNGFLPTEEDVEAITDLSHILMFLQKSHYFYRDYKYPELKAYIEEFKKNEPHKFFLLIEQFFNNYFAEVVEHLKYENNVIFPYFKGLQQHKKDNQQHEFSLVQYQKHHSDTEAKLADLKNLFLKHIKIKSDLNLKRKFLKALLELEFDMNIHSIIEERILMAIVEKLENERNY